jgi:hypothetical protein
MEIGLATALFFSYILGVGAPLLKTCWPVGRPERKKRLIKKRKK